MLAMLPVMVASGFIAALVATAGVAPGEQQAADHWIFNLTLAHEDSINEAAVSGYASGSLSPSVQWPFQDLAAWQGEVVVDGGRTLVMTWPATNAAPSAVARKLAADLQSWLPANRAGGRDLAHFGGGFASAVGGNSLIGSIAIPTPSSLIPDGTPVMASWVFP